MAVKAKAETTIVDMTDAYSVILSSETYTFIGGTAGAQSGLSCATDVTAFCGTNLCSKVQIGTITCPTGITATVSNNNTTTPTITFKTTATISAACEATIPVVVDGITVNKKFSFAVAKTGATGAKGDKGDTGATGKGIKSTSITYQAGTSQTTAPTGTWSTSIPATSTSTPYLWTKTVITYDDDTTSTSYSVSSTLDSLEIGGRNLALASKDFTAGAEYWSVPSSFERSIDEEGFTILSTSRTGTTYGTWDRLIPHKYIPVEEMHKGVVVSFDLKCDSLAEFDHSCVCALQVYAKDGTRIGWREPDITNKNSDYFIYFDKELSDGEWSRISIVFPEKKLKTVHRNEYTVNDVSYASVSFQLVKNGSIHFRKIKIEYGTKATDWTPAPEDLASSDDLDSLTTRVTEAEAEINVNAGNIELKASKSELATVSSAASKAQTTADSVKSNLENNYYTKTQSDANLSVKSDAILASVKSTYTTKEDFDNLEIGGRNLARNTSASRTWKSTSNYANDTWNTIDNVWFPNVEIESGQDYTLSFDYTLENVPDSEQNIGCGIGARSGTYYDSDLWIIVAPYVTYGGSLSSGKFVYHLTAKTLSTTKYFAFRPLRRAGSDTLTTPIILTISNFKLEKGTKATDWTPAPEDLASSDDLDSLTTRVTESESNITQLSNKITAEVSERTALGTRVSTVEQTASGLTTRLTSAEGNISTAQSTANTARSEAANAAKTATNYMNFSSNGLVIGDMTASTLGKNVLIDSDSVNIRNGTNTVATFAEDLIELGKSSTSTVIKLCGGTGTIRSYLFDDVVIDEDDEPYFVFEINSDNLVSICGNEAVNIVVGDNEITMFADVTYVNKPVRFENYMLLENNVALYGESLDADPITLAFIGADNNLHIGYNAYEYNIGTYISGQTIRHRVASAGVSYKPYWEAGDSFSMSFNTAGFISSSSMNVYFTVPLSKPAIGSPAVTISSYNGLTIRQNGNYLYGSSASAKVTPSYYSAVLNSNGNSIVVTATFNYDQIANVINNEACGIAASITITFG